MKGGKHTVKPPTQGIMHLDETLVDEDTLCPVPGIDLDGDITLIETPIDHKSIRKVAAREQEILRVPGHVSQALFPPPFLLAPFDQKVASLRKLTAFSFSKSSFVPFRYPTLPASCSVWGVRTA